MSALPRGSSRTVQRVSNNTIRATKGSEGYTYEVEPGSDTIRRSSRLRGLNLGGVDLSYDIPRERVRQGEDEDADDDNPPRYAVGVYNFCGVERADK